MLLFAAIVIIMQARSSQAQGIGTSQVVLANSTVSISQGSSTSFYYVVKLVSGTTWGTTLGVVNSKNLSSSGISVSLSQSYGDPTYSGVATIKASSLAAPGNYLVIFQANGDDPSSPSNLTLTVLSAASSTTSNTPSNTITPTTSSATPTFKTISIASKMVNASSGASLSVQSGTIRAVIKPGTYALVNGTKEQIYNFSLISFSISNIASPPNTSLIPGEAYAFAVNGRISPSISFVNASGANSPITSYVIAGPNTTSWTWFGGNYSNGTYTGGSYKFADTWQHPNSTTMVNTVFFKPVLWVFESPAPSSSKTTSTGISSNVSSVSTVTTIAPSPTPPSSSSTSTYLYVAAVIVVIIVVVAAVALRSKGRQKTA